MRSLLRFGSLSAIGLCAALAVTTAGGRAWAGGVEPSSATPLQREQAQVRFTHGKDLFAEKKYELALEEFKASFDIVASPNTRLFVARCYREMGRTLDAYVEFGRAVVEAQEHAREDARYARTADAATDERQALAQRLGWVTVTLTNAPQGTTLKVGNTEIGRPGDAIPLMPGMSEILVEPPGRAPLRQVVQLAPGERKTISFDVQTAAAPIATTPKAEPLSPANETADASNEPSSSPKGGRPLAYVAGAIGIAGLATFGIAGSMSKSTYDSLNAACHGPCPNQSFGPDIERGKREQTIANVGLIVGAVGVVAGATIFVLTMPSSSSKTTGSSASVVVGASSVGVRGSF